MKVLKIKIYKHYTLQDLLELFARAWVGYILITNSRIGTLVPLKDLGMPMEIYNILQALWDTGFMMHIAKSIELLAGMALIFNFRIPFVLIFLMPVLINIYGVHVFMFKAYFTKGLGMLTIASYLLWKYRDRYKPLLRK